MYSGGNFLMDTDWIFREYDELGIDYEYLEYKLLAYLNKVDENLEEKKIYPLFPEICLHFTNIESLINNKLGLRYDGKILNHDDEILLSDIQTVSIPHVDNDDLRDLKSILNYSEEKFFKYYFLFKLLWDELYKNCHVEIIKNKENVKLGVGFVAYTGSDSTFIWKYELPIDHDKILINHSNFDLIFTGKTSDDIKASKGQVIKFFKNPNKLPVYDLKVEGDYPIIESILPMAKKKIIDHFNEYSLSLSSRNE